MQALYVHIVEDNPFEAEYLMRLVRSLHPAAIITAYASVKKYFHDLKRSHTANPHLVILDLTLGEHHLGGVEILDLLNKRYPDTKIVIRTCHDDTETLRYVGAYHAHALCVKEKDDSTLKTLISHFMTSPLSSEKISPIMRDLYMTQPLQQWLKRIPRILNSAVRHIHISGPAGSGKESYADILASQLPSPIPFIRINCAAISENLMESELFGHKKGSYTGAVKDRAGVFARAHGGWLFLDEIACLTQPLQAVLLRVLERGEYYPLGSEQVHYTDVKIISATNEDLKQLVEQGKFRFDLYQRLCELEVKTSSISELGDEFRNVVTHMATHLDGGPYKITDAAINLLFEMDWRDGQFRALRNLLRVMTENHIEKVLTPSSIPATYLPKAPSTLQHLPSLGENFEDQISLLLVENIKSHLITEPNISLRKLALTMKLSRSSLMRKIWRAQERQLMPQELIEALHLSSN